MASRGSPERARCADTLNELGRAPSGVLAAFEGIACDYGGLAAAIGCVLGPCGERWTEMSIVVQKYGGSSVADLGKLRDISRKIVQCKTEGHQVVVVVSAMGKTTDDLLRMAREAAHPAEPARRELDMLVSTGERVSMALLSIAIQTLGHEAISFTGSQSGILTSDHHFDARILEVRPYRIQNELDRGRIVIVAGYQGMSYAREITTLGRGGSDTTAVALAAALGASRCEIYSDVDGVYSADPRVVLQARHLAELDLETLAEMAESGAKVVSAQAVEWARRAGVRLFARKATDRWREPGETPRETVAGETMGTPQVRAVVGQDRMVYVRGSAGDWDRLLECAAEVDLQFLHVALHDGEPIAVVPLLNVPDWETKRSFLGRQLPLLHIEEKLSLVSVVGADLCSARNLVRLARALQAANIFSRTLFASPLRVSALVSEEARVSAERALHATFV